VRRSVHAAERVDPAVLIDQLQLLVGVEHERVEERRLVERAGVGALPARAVVPPDVEDQRVVRVAHLLDRVQQPPHVPVGVLREPGEHLHLAGVQLLLGVAQRVPGREHIRALGQLGVRRDHPELLLAGEHLLAQLVPSLGELPLVLVRSFLGDMMGGVGAPG
jgi:hypothetical protein